jgi:DNA-binding transcriptional LysR family regulator
LVPEGDEDIAPLREGVIDLDIGVLKHTGPEVKFQTLFRESFVGAVRRGHPLAKGKVTLKRFVEYRHAVVSRRGRIRNQLDDALARFELSRTVAIVVPTFHAALEVAEACGLVATVPQKMTEHLRKQLGLYSFELPIQYGPLSISQAWHPRFDSDQPHRWLRARVMESVLLKRAGGINVKTRAEVKLRKSA